jgi:hypothetical protein
VCISTTKPKKIQILATEISTKKIDLESDLKAEEYRKKSVLEIAHTQNLFDLLSLSLLLDTPHLTSVH